MSDPAFFFLFNLTHKLIYSLKGQKQDISTHSNHEKTDLWMQVWEEMEIW